MKNYIVLFFLLFSIQSFGQKDMSIDIISSIDYSGTINYDHINNMKLGNISIKSSGTTMVASQRYGVNFNFRIYEKLIFKSGLRLVRLDSRFRANYNYTSPCIIPGQLHDPSELRYIEELSSSYIEFPLMVRYEYGKKKFQPYIEGGVTPHFYLDSNRNYKTIYENGFQVENEEETSELKNTQVVLALSIGANYYVSEHITLFIQPIVRYHMNEFAINSDESKARFYSFGLEFGIRFSFGSYFYTEK